MIIEGFYNKFTYTNDTLIRNPDIVRILGLVGKKEEAQNILNGTWTPPTYIKNSPKYPYQHEENPNS